ncbi:hypothetical protein [Streptomyces sp. NPDC093970]|uniref:hypothetical protein n=1 Tax=Streptomyces sp. NPDC093970 TaxID=3155076 RepID=UPI003445146C
MALRGHSPRQAVTRPWRPAGDRRRVRIDDGGKVVTQRAHPCLASASAEPSSGGGIGAPAPGRSPGEVGPAVRGRPGHAAARTKKVTGEKQGRPSPGSRAPTRRIAPPPSGTRPPASHTHRQARAPRLRPSPRTTAQAPRAPSATPHRLRSGRSTRPPGSHLTGQPTDAHRAPP